MKRFLSVLLAVRSRLGVVRRGLHRRVARLLHPRRREKALTRLRAHPRPGRVLALCLGNVCRSPYVEAYLRARGTDLGMAVESAGFIGPGRHPPDDAVRAAQERGVDTRSHVSRLVSGPMLDEADLVVLVDPRHARRLRPRSGASKDRVLILGDLDPEPIDSRTIQDPWGKDPEDFRRVFARIERCLDVMLEEWRPTAAP